MRKRMLIGVLAAVALSLGLASRPSTPVASALDGATLTICDLVNYFKIMNRPREISTGYELDLLALLPGFGAKQLQVLRANLPIKLPSALQRLSGMSQDAVTIIRLLFALEGDQCAPELSANSSAARVEEEVRKRYSDLVARVADLDGASRDLQRQLQGRTQMLYAMLGIAVLLLGSTVFLAIKRVG